MDFVKDIIRRLSSYEEQSNGTPVYYCFESDELPRTDHPLASIFVKAKTEYGALVKIHNYCSANNITYPFGPLCKESTNFIEGLVTHFGITQEDLNGIRFDLKIDDFFHDYIISKPSFQIIE